MVKLRSCLAILTSALILSSCATAIRGSHDKITIVTVPAGATVQTDIPLSGSSRRQSGSGGTGVYFGCAPTPCEIDIPRRANGLVTVTLPEHQSISYRIVSSVTTSNDVVRPGALIAGLPPGTHVVVGTPRAGTQIGLNLLNDGLVDELSGATLNLAPQAVTVYFAPLAPADAESEE